MFRRSKQSLGESSKDLSVNLGVPPLEHASVTAESTFGIEAPRGGEVQDDPVTSGPLCTSQDANDVRSDLLLSEGCAIEERVALGISSQDERGLGEPKAPETADKSDVVMTIKIGVHNSPGIDVLHRAALNKGETGSCEDVGLGNKTQLTHLDVVLRSRGKEKRVRLQSRETRAFGSSQRNVDCDVCPAEAGVVRDVGCKASSLMGQECSPECSSETGVTPMSTLVHGLSGGRSPSDTTQPVPMSVIRTERFFSQHIGTNLVTILCRISGLALTSLRSNSNKVWRCVPYLTLFLRQESPSHASEKCSMSQIGLRLAPSSIRRSSSLASAKLVLVGARSSSFDGSTPLHVPEHEVHWNVEEQLLDVTSSVEDSPPADRAETDSICPHVSEPRVVENSASIAVHPDVQALDSKEENIHQGGNMQTNDISCICSNEAPAPGLDQSVPSAHCADKNVSSNVNGASRTEGSGVLTDVQIGSAVEGEEDSSIAIYRTLKGAKRGLSQITDVTLGSSGLGTEGRLQDLLDSDLACMAFAKRQKVHVESINVIESGLGIKKDGEKKILPIEAGVNGEKNWKCVDSSDLALPRMNVLKLKRCPTNKGLWRVAGNSVLAERSIRPSGDGGEPLTPSSIGDRKRPFSHCFEFYQPGSPGEETDHFMDGSYANGQEMSNVEGNDELKATEIWSNCEVSSIHDVTFNSRKRLKTGSTSSGSSEDGFVTHSRAEETYGVGDLNDHVYSDSLGHRCIANVLVVQNDRGWREMGANIEIQSSHGQGWMLIVSVRGEHLYAYKAEQAIVTGTTNRHNHAVVWKGGKGWSLEFDDRKQWQVFKELHEECYRRNAKASSGRQIPIPGVRYIDDIAARSPGGPFTRPYGRYICRVEDEVESALGSSRVVYDMDSEDEHWLAQVNNERANARGTRTRPLIAEETLERLMDRLEKNAYLRQQQQKGVELSPGDVAAESCNGLASLEVIKVVYAHWVDKRMQRGMPLIRYFQPPAWEQYQKQLHSWEQEIARFQQQSPLASRQQLMQEFRKPPLFAFCLRPLGLEARHKLLKQRSHRKQFLPGSASRQWTSPGIMENALDSPGKRPLYRELTNGVTPEPRRPGRPRLAVEVPADRTGSFDAIGRESTLAGGVVSSTGFRKEPSSVAHSELAQRRARKSKKLGRKARRLRLLAAAQESRRKRLLLRNMSPVELQQQPDVALAAAVARSKAEAARARAQALYAVADAAMHKAVAAVIAADALRAIDQQQGEEQEERAAFGGDLARGPVFGSWRRGVAVGASGGIVAKGSSSRQGLVSDGEDALLPVASWSQELGAGLGTRLLNKDARMEGIINSRSAHLESPTRSGGLGRTRGESMVAMLSR